jgi:hypothetical protein
MPYERGLAHYQIGRHLESSDPQRAAHLDEARQLFDGIGAASALAGVDLVSSHEPLNA